MSWANFLEPGRQGLGIFKVGRGQNDKAQQSPGELPTLTGGFKKKDRLSQVHELKVMFQHLLKGNYRLTSQNKPLLLSLHLKYRIVPMENRWLRKPWTGLSWVKVFTQGPFQGQRSHVSTFPARRGDFSICKMGCGLEPGSWFQNISLNPRQTLSWGHLIVERSSQTNSQRGLADSQKK